jgi:hypothetical protein
VVPLRYNLRSLAVRKATTAATGLGIGLVVFVLSASQMLADGIEHTLGSAGAPDRAIVLRTRCPTWRCAGYRTTSCASVARPSS